MRFSIFSSRSKNLCFQLFYFTIITLVLVPALSAQVGRGAISGRVADPGGAVLQGAKVELDPFISTISTNGQGEFVIRDVPAGTYTLTVRFVGFGAFTQSVTVTAGQMTRVDAVMRVASKSEEIMVYAEQAHGQAEAINRERAADNILQVLPQDVITSLPNANVADAIGRLPSVTLERDEGEGKYVQIRGTEPRLSNLTIDGINVPSPESGVRQVKLDTIPADIVESVEINKTLQANMDGDGIGGSVNLVTKTAGETPTITAFGIGGYTPIDNGRKVDQFGATIGQRFGTQKRWGALAGATYDYNQRGIDDIEPVPYGVQGANGAVTPAYNSMDVREYLYNRVRWGGAGSIDYKLNEGSDIWLRGLYSDFKDYGDRFRWTLNDVVASPGSVPSYSDDHRRPDFGIGDLAVGGKHLFATSWFAWTLSFARSRQLDSAGDPGDDFSYIPSTSNCTFSPTLTTNLYKPQWNPVCYQEAYNPSNFQMADLITSYGQAAQVNLQGEAAYAKNYHLFGHFSTFEFGGKVRNEHKFDDSYQVTITPTGLVPMTQILGTFKNSSYYGGAYPIGPVGSYDKTVAYVLANPGQFTYANSNVNGHNNNNFDLVERVSAGYFMDTIDLGKFRVVGGVRFEGTQVSTISYDTTTNLFNVPGGGDYVNVLPSASVRYAINANSGIRAVFGRGLARPNPQDLTTAVSFDGVNTYTIGNPALKAEHANNYDLLYERYLQPLGLIQAGFFYKQLGDPIVTEQSATRQTSGPYNGFFVQEAVNGGSAHVGGFEIAYQQQMSYLPGFLSGFGLMANYSWTTSTTAGLPGRSDHPALLRQAPNTWNISPSYDRGRFSARLGLSYNQANIYAYQYSDGTPFGTKGPGGDNYLYSHLQVDAQGSFRFYKGFQAVVYGLNLNNEVFGFYNGSPQYVVQREYYKQTIAGGVRWTHGGEHK